jgi:hypothetical protein
MIRPSCRTSWRGNRAFTTLRVSSVPTMRCTLASISTRWCAVRTHKAAQSVPLLCRYRPRALCLSHPIAMRGGCERAGSEHHHTSNGIEPGDWAMSLVYYRTWWAS